MLLGDTIYGTNQEGPVAADFASGKIRWRAEGVGPGAVFFAEDRLYFHGENGDVSLAEASPDAGRPVPAQGPEIRWPPQGVELETHTTAGSPLRRRIAVLAKTLIVYLIFRVGRPIGPFVPARYMRQVVENSDYRKYDDGLRMILDCTPALADALEQRLAAATGVARYGLFRQDAAMMTCFTPSPLRADHVHFVDGARGGYAAAATALKTAFAGAK